MLTLNFSSTYLELALCKMTEIEECNYFAVIELINYLNSVPKYSVCFPQKFKFSLPDGKYDESYNTVVKTLISECLYIKDNNFLKLTDKGKKFFEKLEQLCLETQNSFEKYFSHNC